jgi:hypothetical protein
VNPDGAHPELYDLAADAKEARNLATTNPELVRDLMKQVLAWRATWPPRP